MQSKFSSLLNAGALPVDLKEMYSTSVGAKFGQQALEETIFASVIGIALIFLFMLVFYRLPGFIAVIMLGLYIFMTLLVFNWMHAVLTLPGIAALVLGVGIAVDANIITYERLKEELRIGKSMMSAYRSGNHRSLATILDANITTLAADRRAICIWYKLCTRVCNKFDCKYFCWFYYERIRYSFLTRITCEEPLF